MTTDTAHVVTEEFTDKHHSRVRRVFTGDDSLDHAKRFIAEHDGHYEWERVQVDSEYRPKNE